MTARRSTKAAAPEVRCARRVERSGALSGLAPLLSAALGAWLSLAPLQAHAQVPFSEIQDVARAKAEEGLALFAERRWQDAYERFRIAEDLFHAPTLVLHMAHCQRELGRLLAARALYRKVAEEKPAEDAPEAFRKAQEIARERLAELEERIPRISVDIPGQSSEGLLVLLDGGPVVALHPADIELDPGRHRIHAAARGAEPVDMTLDVAERERRRVRIAMKAVAPPPPPPPPGSLMPGGIALGVGLGGLALGAITGGITLARTGTIRESCDGARCPDTLREDADALRPVAMVSNVGFTVGGLGLAAGIVLLIVRPKAGTSSVARPKAGTSSVASSLVVGPGGVGGRF
ncbi:tetratricopeptide repeat protein [Chondromyces apiculatus]|uniref:PEGA domain-containing protein n=1 Tax=Chondromyces apiculatus DSM 436 TaxID=1192034 RepID=A0A017T9C9_9BACT|nr:hypothetical protein [Chondromyces apiculatus]EYF05211.1 Hypothetical protein CAP_3576 [Chondromyces apiculatus DSM 436]